MPGVPGAVWPRLQLQPWRRGCVVLAASSGREAPLPSGLVASGWIGPPSGLPASGWISPPSGLILELPLEPAAPPPPPTPPKRVPPAPRAESAERRFSGRPARARQSPTENSRNKEQSEQAPFCSLATDALPIRAARIRHADLQVPPASHHARHRQRRRSRGVPLLPAQAAQRRPSRHPASGGDAGVADLRAAA